MKKSEMIDIICEVMGWGNYKRHNAEFILSELEEAGMVPPNQYASTNEFRFEWEDEDEEK